MKYSQACLLKKHVDVSIEKLTNNVAGPGANHVVRTRVEVSHVSGIEKWTSLILIGDERKSWRNWKDKWP